MEKLALETNAMVPVIARIMRVRKELSDTWTLEIEPPDGSFSFAGGQFNMLYAFGVGEIPISISGDPAQPDVLLHTVRNVGAVTNAITSLKKGEMLGVRGPFGQGWPIDICSGKDIVIIAGGIGLAPLRPTLYQLISDRRRYGRISLLYGARTPDMLLYARELEQWGGKFDLDVLVSVDAAPDTWRGNVGPVTTLIPRTTFDVNEAIAFMCGPEIMMRYAARDLMDHGLTSDQIFLSLERNMKCALGFCGHCQYGPEFVCKDGPVFAFSRMERLFKIREV